MWLLLLLLLLSLTEASIPKQITVRTRRRPRTKPGLPKLTPSGNSQYGIPR
jgi:hypothetical protein